MKSNGNPFNPIVAIIGGKGEIGKTFVKAFKKINLKVLIVEKENQTQLKKIVQHSDIIILSVPIKNTSEIIKEVGPLLNSRQLLMDFTSIKKDAITLMENKTDAEIISLHPLFGPLHDISNQNIIVMKIRSKCYFPKIKKMFTRLKLKVVELNINEHDKIMTIVQSLIHLMAFSLVATIKELEFSFQELKKFSTPLYRLHIDLASRLLYQSSELYTDISFLNPYLKKVGDTFNKNLGQLLKDIKQKNRKKFIETFEQNANFLKNKKSAFLRSEKIMEYLAKIE